MILLLLALADGPASQEGQATLQSCEMTASGWVCHYKMPPVTLLGTPDSAPPVIVSRPPETVEAPVGGVGKAEAARQARLIANCADASWLSLCLPGDRREARRLRDEANARAALRAKVTGLLAEDRCAEAVKTALTGGDMDLAREARAFCAR